MPQQSLNQSPMVIDLAVGTINLNNQVRVPASNRRTDKNKSELQSEIVDEKLSTRTDQKLEFHCGSDKAVVLHVS